MKIENVVLVFMKDWREIRRNWQIILPVVTVPIVFSVFLPLVTLLIPYLAGTSMSATRGFENLIENLPSQAQLEIAGMTEQQRTIYMIALYFFAPFFLIIPLMASSVLASDSFAGEKERKTIEALLATPISDTELFLGKTMVSFVPAMAVTILAFTLYSVIVNAISFSVFDGKMLLPNLVWILLIFGVAPTIALAGIGLTVIISARVKGAREAQQISALLLIPIFVLLFGQASGAVVLGPLVVVALIGLFVLIDALVIYLGVRLFHREEILSRLA
ncbi:MAG: ABC transporter permease [Thaumarchaeota archaeon]|nr:ABC transporter permease [Nitrososphaerota archaeon]MCL5318391.1 ABC transporter permease [Nitrososphaerota archaeon]